jgi:hypothetical protein
MPHEKATAGAGIVSMRSYFSSWHLWAAQHFTRLAEEIEAQHNGKRSASNIRLQAYVTNAVLSAAAFLEAAINEIYDDIADEHPGYADPLAPATKRLLAGLWGRVERWPILEKYQAALLCAGLEAFEKGQPPFEDAKLLIDLRNRLMHARPKTQATGEVDDLSKRLMPRFKPSRLMEGSGNPYFPSHCLGAGCANWAVISARTFADEFFHRYGIRPNYQRSSFA